MSKRCRAGAVAALAVAPFLTPTGVGVAAADPVVQSVQSKETISGYRMTLSLEDVKIQSVPNMAAAPLVREGYVTATAKLVVVCARERRENCPTITDSTVTVWAQVGCPMDMSKPVVLQPGGTFVAGLPQTLGALLPQEPADIANLDIAPTVSGPGQVAITTRPGYINDVSMGMRAFPAIEDLSLLTTAAKLAKGLPPDSPGVREIAQGISAALAQSPDDPGGMVVSVENRHLVVSKPVRDDLPEQTGACGGPVAVRMRALATLGTSTSPPPVGANGQGAPAPLATSEKMEIFGAISTL